MSMRKLLIFTALVLLVALPTSAALAQVAALGGTGTAIISDDLALSDAITFSMTNVTPAEAGTEYVGWLVSDDTSIKLNTGAMAVDADGVLNHTFDSTNSRYTGENLIHAYSRAVITVEAAGADPDAPVGPAVFVHQIPLAGMTHIRHLLTNWPVGSDKGILTRLNEQIQAAIDHIDLATGSDTLTLVQLYTHHVINIIEGEGGANFDASFGNPGDGTGVLSHAADGIRHADLAIGAASDDAVIVAHAGLLKVDAQNVIDTATAAADQSVNLVLAQSDRDTAKLFLGGVRSLLANALDGVDTDGDGTIESIVGEGGASQAYVEAQLMATFTLFASSDPLVVEGAVIWDDQALSDAITYTMTNVPPPAAGSEYVGWLLSDDGSIKLSTGPMAVSGDGTIDHTFDSTSNRYTGENLIHAYSRAVITAEVAGADPDAPAGPAALAHQVPLAGMTHIRHLLTNWPVGSDKGILTRLNEQIQAAIDHIDLATGSDTLTLVQLYTHHVLNIIEGEGGANFDASFGNPGDGTGVLSHAADGIVHANLAIAAASTDAVIVAHAGLLKVDAQNAIDTATEAADQSVNLVLAQSDRDTAKLFLGGVRSLLANALEGVDADGDGTIESIVGEGGASQAYVEAQRMATFTLEFEPGVAPPSLPTTGPGTGDPTVPLLFQIALIASGLFLAAGGLLVFSARRRSRARS